MENDIIRKIERRRRIISNDDIQAIVDRLEQRDEQKENARFAEIGRSVVRRSLYLLGATVVAIVGWAAYGSGKISLSIFG